MKNKCFFCEYEVKPTYKDIVTLEKFLTMRKKIVSRENNQLCTRHQRELSKQIKYARYLALLPYISYRDLR
jgi:small subunit ribosomal protein S18